MVENNINSVSHEECTGCNACVQVCPKLCIEKVASSDGFVYPKVDILKCVNCGRCLQVCPTRMPLCSRTPLFCYAAYNKEDKRRNQASSGGIFIEIANYIIDKHGVVFGAVFDEDWNVIHTVAETMEQVFPMMGSKYVQSDTLNTFTKCKEMLDAGRYVLFTGTPCQIAALNKYIHSDYPNLITMDFVCHGVPSPGLWSQYLSEVTHSNAAVKAADGKNTVLNSSLNAMSLIRDIKFRDKTDGWEKFRFVVRKKSASKADQNSVLLSDIYYKNPYMKGFLNDLYLRDSCYHCPARAFSSGSDITVGDLWGVNKLGLQNMNDHRGLSIVTVNSSKGNLVLKAICNNLVLHELTYEEAILSNSNLVSSSEKKVQLIAKFEANRQTMSLIDAIEHTLHVGFLEKILVKIKHKMILYKWKK